MVPYHWTLLNKLSVDVDNLFWLYQEGHEEAQEELPKKVKTFFSTAVQNWDADFYVKVDDGIDIDLGKDCLYIYIFLFRSFVENYFFPNVKLRHSLFCSLACRGFNWTSWPSSWSGWGICWMHEVRRSDIRRVLSLSEFIVIVYLYMIIDVWIY